MKKYYRKNFVGIKAREKVKTIKNQITKKDKSVVYTFQLSGVFNPSR